METKALSLRVPPRYVPDPLLDGAPPETTALILDYGVCLFRHASSVASAPRDACASLSEHVRDDIRSVSADIAALTSRFDGVFSSRAAAPLKGQEGEANLADLLSSLFPDAEVEDCSASPGQGDATLAIERGGAIRKLMVESKNVARVRSSDIRKFERDCENRAGEVQGALFASLTAEAIPHRGTVSFGVVSGIPVLYLAAVLARPEALRLGVEALLFSAAAARAESPSDCWAGVREAVSVAFSVLSRQSARVRALRESAAAMLEAAAAFEKESSVAAAAIEALYQARPDLRPKDPGLTPVDPAASAALRVRRFIDDEQRDPTRSEVIRDCGVPEALLRRVGGARALIAQARKLCA